MESQTKIVTLQRHIMEQQALHPAATGEFTRLLWDLVLAFKMISREVNRAGLAAILGLAGKENVQGEQVTKLDDYAQARIYEQMDHGGHLCCMASEEADGLIPIPERFPKGKYVLLFDPLDGSSNVDVNASLGTIFSIHRKRYARRRRYRRGLPAEGQRAGRRGLRGLRLEHDAGLHGRPRRTRLHPRSLARRVPALAREHPHPRSAARATASTRATRGAGTKARGATPAT